MKFLFALAIAGLAFSLVACGSGEATGSGERAHRFGTITYVGKFERPHIEPPARPVPKRTLVRDLEVGSGAIAHRGNRIWVRYIAVDYETGKEQYHRWSPRSPLEFRLGFVAAIGNAWEGGIEGMRVGGRREMIIPSRLLYDIGYSGSLDYVVELVRVKPAPGRAGKG